MKVSSLTLMVRSAATPRVSNHEVLGHVALRHSTTFPDRMLRALILLVRSRMNQPAEHEEKLLLLLFAERG